MHQGLNGELVREKGVRDKETRDAVSSDFIVVETLDYTVLPGTNCSGYSESEWTLARDFVLLRSSSKAPSQIVPRSLPKRAL